ncbi:hypothetical protein [Pseudoalteromonas luteoviolacea]|uniref:hypothetical protein n=1 Tax=Pseudoalteromonas luteoviolacea TaxID=43657 RepID=UPI00114EB8FA|nr:hypothetical protein [Pseudoalteromonas luteoviolacea]TQF70101.1 hypothetical protein FLM44_03130 [Pseudoalteromonas luteoviolacea]
MLKSTDSIVEAIFDQDGSFRDFNFIAADIEQTMALVGWFEKHFSSVSCLSSLGAASNSSTQLASLTKLKPTNYAQIVCEGTSFFISHIQLFLCVLDSGLVDIEISFCPQDVNQEKFELSAFFKLMKTWQSLARADVGYLRYEDGSWEYGDTHSIIYISKLV